MASLRKTWCLVRARTLNGVTIFMKSPVVIVGACKYIFSEKVDILGDVAAGKEQTFGMLAARSMALIGGKLHDGHPKDLTWALAPS